MPVCLADHCPVIVPRGTRRCPEHEAAYRCAHPRGEYAGRTGTTQAWRKLKAAAKRRDGGRCTATLEDGTRCPLPTASYHHVTPLYMGGQDVLANVVSRCKRHHDQEHAERPGWGQTPPPLPRGGTGKATRGASAHVPRFKVVRVPGLRSVSVRRPS